MSDVGSFIVYCIELYKERQGISGAEAYRAFSDCGIDYIKTTYPALHTMSENLIYDDLVSVVGDWSKPLVSA
jgi:hypothetical protein